MSVSGFSGAANWVRRVGAHSFPIREQIRFWGAEPQGAWGRFSELRGSRRNDFNVGEGLCRNNVGTAFPTSQSGVETLDLPQAWKLPAFAKPDRPFQSGLQPAHWADGGLGGVSFRLLYIVYNFER